MYAYFLVFAFKKDFFKQHQLLDDRIEPIKCFVLIAISIFKHVYRRNKLDSSINVMQNLK